MLGSLLHFFRRGAGFSPSLLILLSACGAEDGTRDPGFSTFEDGGVIISENGGLHLADTLAWVLDTTEVLRIGLAEGPEEYVFGRLGGMILTADGHILVGDALANELRLFDETGQFIQKAGREGEGPGEFGGVNRLRRLCGDTVAVISDPRVDILDPTLGFVRRFRPHLTEMSAEPPFTSDKLENLFGDGMPLMSDFLSVCRSGTGGMCVDSILFHRTDESGQIKARYGQFVWARTESHQVPGGPSFGWREPHPQAFWAVHGDRFYYADAQRFEIMVFGPAGRLERRIRVNVPAQQYARDVVYPPSPSPEPTGNPRMDQVMRVGWEARQNASLPDTFPSFSDMILDEEGNIWVRQYHPDGAVDSQPWWWVFNPEGRLRWAVRSPPGLVRSPNPVRRLDPYIGTDRIVASIRDEYGVESVVVYRLRKR